MNAAELMSGERTTRLDLADVEWSPHVPVPTGIAVESWRRRGFDFVRLRLRTDEPRIQATSARMAATVLVTAIGYWWFNHLSIIVPLAMGGFEIGLALRRRAARREWNVLVFADRLTIETGATPDKPREEFAIAFADIERMSVEPSGLKRRAALVIATRSRRITIGEGLSSDALRWLKGYLTMEAVQLIWKPIFEFGRKTTRKTSAADAAHVARREPPPKLAALYLAEAPGRLAELQSAVARKDPIAIKRSAHWLKSSSANVGAVELSNESQLMEIYGLDNDLEKVDVLVRQIEIEFEDVRAWLEGIVQRGPHAAALAKPEAMPALEIDRRPRPYPLLGSGRAKPEIVEAASASGPAHGEAASSETSAEPIFAGKELLVVDDSAVNREVARDALETLGCHVETAATGEEAVARCVIKRFDVVLMDCQMPGVDGFEATRRIRAHEDAESLIPLVIVALTGNALRGDRDLCLAAGMSDYISKPYTTESLEAVLHKWLVPPPNMPMPDFGDGDEFGEFDEEFEEIGDREAGTTPEAPATAESAAPSEPDIVAPGNIESTPALAEDRKPEDPPIGEVTTGGGTPAPLDQARELAPTRAT